MEHVTWKWDNQKVTKSIFWRWLIFVFALAVIGLIVYGVQTYRVPHLSIKNSTGTVKSAPTNSQPKIAGVVVPHHDIVKEQRRAFFSEVAGRVQPPTVVIIGPNHFDAGQGQIISTKKEWDLAAGHLKSNEMVIAALDKAGLVEITDAPFVREHSIANILPDIQAVWPQSKVVSLIVRETVPAETLQKLETVLTATCPDCLVVASVDFSHYQPRFLAEIHDVLAGRILTTADQKQLNDLEIDSSASLTVLMQWAADRQAKNFVLKQHTNSGALANNDDAETTTHFMGWYETGETTPPVASRTFMLGGDLMLGRDIATLYQKNNFASLWSNLGERTFWGVDFSWVNLEGPISTASTVPPIAPNNLHFIFPAGSVSFLKNSHLKYVGLANNHTGTFGATQLATTRKLLSDGGITPLGDPNQVQSRLLPATNPGELPLGVVLINGLSGTDGVSAEIKKLKDERAAVIVIPHWGAEYNAKHSPGQADLAHAWIDAGADLVIGSHPHVIQDAEIYQGKPIIYSLGNLVFDQWFSVPTQQGLLVGGKFTDKKLTLVLQPLKMTRGRPELLQGAEKERILKPLCADLAAGDFPDCLKGGFVEMDRNSK